MNTIVYIHTLDGKPAHFHSGMILIPSPAMALPSEKDFATIKRQRATSVAARKALNWDIPKYAHVRIRIEKP